VAEPQLHFSAPAPRIAVERLGPGERMSDVVIDKNVMVAMRDGVRLATDVHRPAKDGKPLPGPFPVIVERTPYDKSGTSRSERTRAHPQPKTRAEVAASFVGRGYVVVFQDCRGRFESEGRFTKYLDDGHDGVDTLAWLLAQPWCDGKIGTMGLSYGAHTQVALGCLDPPGLACQVIDSGGFSNAYLSGIRQGGAFELKQATWAFNHARNAPEVVRDPVLKMAMDAIDLKDWFTRMPWRPGHSPLALVPDYESYLFEQWTRGTFGDYWKQAGIYAEGFYDRYADVPMVHLSSWYDAYTRTATENFVGLRRRMRSPIQLVLGPWTHGDRSDTFAGDVDFGADATLDGALAADFVEFRLRWFDRWLKAIDNGAERDPAVRLFLMGGGSGRRNAAGRMDHGGHWVTATDWPLPEARPTDYFLHRGGLLSPEPPAEDEAPISFDYDPRHPVPSIGGTMTSGQPLMEGGAYDQREEPRFFGCRPPYLPLSSRPDILVFQTPPLTAEVEVVGPIVVRLFVASDAPDTDFTAKLVDVCPPNPDYPHGFAMNVTDGIFRMRYRNSWTDPAPMTAGAVYEIAIQPFATANRFGRGHRIRVDISSSNFPHFDVNTNTFEPEGGSRLVRAATNTVFVDRARASRIVLPLLGGAPRRLAG
jgi:putative CocE/NonD family hydrolase